jgi:hypothetical protein
MLPCESLYRFDEHSIYPELDPLVKLVKGEELDVLLYNYGGSCVVDTIPPIFFGQPWLLSLKQGPSWTSIN